jgi:Ran GTPase-activating protein (RanGAP) involved in mRNA processing and transport
MMQTLTDVDLSSNEIGEIGAEYLCNILQNNTVKLNFF